MSRTLKLSCPYRLDGGEGEIMDNMYNYYYGLYCPYDIKIVPDNDRYSGICKHRTSEIEICRAYRDNTYVVGHEVAHAWDYTIAGAMLPNGEKVADICGLALARYSSNIARYIRHARSHKELITKGCDAFYGIEPGENISIDMMHRCISILLKMNPFFTRDYVRENIIWAISQIGYILDFNVERIITISEEEPEVCVKNTTRGMIYNPTTDTFRFTVSTISTISTINTIRTIRNIRNIRNIAHSIIIDKRTLIRAYAHPLLA